MCTQTGCLAGRLRASRRSRRRRSVRGSAPRSSCRMVSSPSEVSASRGAFVTVSTATHTVAGPRPRRCPCAVIASAGDGGLHAGAVQRDRSTRCSNGVRRRSGHLGGSVDARVTRGADGARVAAARSSLPPSRRARSARRRWCCRTSGDLEGVAASAVRACGQFGLGRRPECAPRWRVRRAAPPPRGVARHGLCATPPSAMRASAHGVVVDVECGRRRTPARRRRRPGRGPCGTSNAAPSGGGGISTAVIRSPRRQRGVAVGLVAGQPVQFGERYAVVRRRRRGHDDLGVESGHAPPPCRRDATATQCVGGAEDRRYSGVAARCAEQPVPGVALVARRGDVLEVDASRALQQVAAGGGQVAQLTARRRPAAPGRARG